VTLKICKYDYNLYPYTTSCAQLKLFLSVAVEVKLNYIIRGCHVVVLNLKNESSSVEVIDN
jgi:hypothetical protein